MVTNSLGPPCTSYPERQDGQPKQAALLRTHPKNASSSGISGPQRRPGGGQLRGGPSDQAAHRVGASRAGDPLVGQPYDRCLRNAQIAVGNFSEATADLEP
jgi:hypothetical protein